MTVPQSLDRYVYTVNNPLRYVDPTGEDWFSTVDVFAGWASQAWSAVSNWWSSSSFLDKIDMAMNILGFIPGLDVIADVYTLGRSLAGALNGEVSWAEVGFAVAMLALPIGLSYYKAAKAAKTAMGGAVDVGRTAGRAENAAEGAKAAAKADNVAVDPRGPRPKYAANEAHVKAQHHNPSKSWSESQFAPGEGGQKFADEIYDNPSVSVAQQIKDRRYVYVVDDMGRDVGQLRFGGGPTRSGTVITDLNGRVITQFPGKPSWWA